MARPRTPTKVLELRGGLHNRPSRAAARADEVEPEPGLGDPPDYLDESQKARWAELVAGAPAGVLTRMDRPGAVQLSRLWAKAIRGELTIGGEKLLAQVLRSFGLTPSGRAEVPGPGKKKDADKPANPFSRLGDGRR